MDGGDLSDLNDLMVFGERLRLLARLQASYLDELRGEGFDEEQAFQLVRDWSNRGFDWTVRWVPTGQSLEDQLREVEERASGVSGEAADRRDPSVAPPSEPYLLPEDLDEAA